MQNLYVSIIVAVYNEEKNLKQCFESLNNQTCRNFEVIFVDDGSTDNSFQLLLELREQYSELDIKILQQENQGAMSARKFAVENSKYDYICYHDCDDKISPNAVHELLLPFLKNDDIDATLLDLYTENSSGEFKEFQYFSNNTILDGKDCFVYTFSGWEMHNSACYKKSIFLQAHNIYQKYNPSLENWVNNDEIFFKICWLLSRQVIRTQAIYYYQNNMQSTTKKNNPNFYKYLKNEKLSYQIAQDYDMMKHQKAERIITHVPEILRVIYKRYLRDRHQLNNRYEWIAELKDTHRFCMKHCYPHLSFKWKRRLIKMWFQLLFLK